MSDTDKLIADAMAAAHDEGVSMAIIGAIEARLFNELERIRRARRAASILPLVGAEVAAERLGCHRATVYRRAEKAAQLTREKVA
jgi:hypothetical protein